MRILTYLRLQAILQKCSKKSPQIKQMIGKIPPSVIKYLINLIKNIKNLINMLKDLTFNSFDSRNKQNLGHNKMTCPLLPRSQKLTQLWPLWQYQESTLRFTLAHNHANGGSREICIRKLTLESNWHFYQALCNNEIYLAWTVVIQLPNNLLNSEHKLRQLSTSERPTPITLLE